MFFLVVWFKRNRITHQRYQHTTQHIFLFYTFGDGPYALWASLIYNVVRIEICFYNVC